jgi:hypothetical protein
MTDRPKLTRWDAIWAGGFVALFLSLGVAAGTPYFDVVRVLLAIVVVLLGISDWRTKGHGWLPTLSWAVPFGARWAGGQWLVDGSKILVLLVYVLGAVPLMLMIVSQRASKWWYEVVLRRPYMG